MHTIFRMPLNAEHVQVCQLAVIETATADTCASGTATGMYSWERREVKLLNKEFEEASTHALIVVDLDLLNLKARVARSERLQARTGWQLLPASPSVSLSEMVPLEV